MGRIFAIGDIHGHLTKLEELLGKLPIDPQVDEVVFLGDYIDRGPDSMAVMDRLVALSRSLPRATFLMGNHESMFLEDYLGRTNEPRFFFNGGASTLQSYNRRGIDPRRDGLPAEHREFLGRLKLWRESEGWVFVHAGLRPGLPLIRQDRRDLLWIREEFYSAESDWPYRVVFGHTPFQKPYRRGRLTGIDTGAAYGGKLTCLVIPDEEFIQA